MTEWPDAACTAHRALPNPEWTAGELARVVAKLRADHRTARAHCGMALGGDLAWGEAAVSGGLRLHAHVPYPQQPDRWPVAQRARWRSLWECAAEERTVYGDLDAAADGQRSKLAPKLLHARNDGMLDQLRPGVLVAVWVPARQRGGTWSAVNKAAKRRLPIIWVDPEAQRTCVPRPETVAGLLQLAPIPER